MTDYNRIMKDIEMKRQWKDTDWLEDVRPDNVNNPPHYNRAGIECIDAIEAALSPEELGGYYKGNILKYTWRERYKNGIEDLKKAQWYLNKLIETQEKE